VGLTLNVTSGQAIDVTLDIGLPQLEFGASVTSAISTTGAAVARAADVATMPVGSWFNAAAGTFAVEYQVPYASLLSGSGNPGPIDIDDGGSANVMAIRQVTPNTTEWTAYIANSKQTGTPTRATSWASNVTSKIGVTYSGTAVSLSANGTAAVLSTWAAAPTGMNRLLFGAARTAIINGTISRVRYWPRALSANELQAATT
jgi:hypothetical protein